MPIEVLLLYKYLKVNWGFGSPPIIRYQVSWTEGTAYFLIRDKKIPVTFLPDR